VCDSSARRFLVHRRQGVWNQSCVCVADTERSASRPRLGVRLDATRVLSRLPRLTRLLPTDEIGHESSK
jgi:hypothetical protein